MSESVRPDSARSNVILVGMTGSGKSCTGRLLADWLGCRLNDIDATIEYETGRGIAKIFAEDGEGRFRELEAEAILRAAAGPPSVIAVGGGAFQDSRNRAVLKKTGVVVYLRAAPEVLAGRLRHTGHRPLIAGMPVLDRIREMLRLREPAYLEADHIVETDALAIPEVVARILERLGRRPAP